MKIMPDLKSFIGTTQYHKLSMFKRLNYTDGFKYLCDKVEAHWVADILESVAYLPKIKQNDDFIVWVMDIKDNKGTIKAYSDSEGEDPKTKLNIYSNTKKLYAQTLPYTDFPEGRFEFYQINGVVLLKGEY